MIELSKTIESLVVNLVESQNEIVTKLRVESPTPQAVVLLEKAGNNLKEIIAAYETLAADHDLITAKQVMEMNFFPEGTMSVDKLYRLARQNKIPAIRFDGSVFFSRKALREFILEQCKNNITSLEEKRQQKEQRKAARYESQIRAIPE